MLHFYIDTLEMDGCGYVDTCTTFKEGGKSSFITIYPFLTLANIDPLIILMGENLDRIRNG